MLTASALLALAVLAWPSLPPGRARPSDVLAAEGLGSSCGVRVPSWARLRKRRGDGWVADFAEGVAVGLSAGLDLPAAALASADSPGVVAAAPWLVRRLQVGVPQGRGVALLLDLGRVLDRGGDSDLDLDLDLGVDLGTGAGTSGNVDPGPGAGTDGTVDPGIGTGTDAPGPGGSPASRPGTTVPLTGQERADLQHLVAAWRLAEVLGAGASTVTTSAAESVRERQAARERTAVVVAGPRASMLLLSALPLAGPAAALVVGLPPGRLYDSAASRVLAAGGLVLTVLGWWWASRLLRRAQRPARTGAGAS